MAAPLADPGTVIRLSRGTTAEQIAAMPDIARKRDRSAGQDDAVEKPDGSPSSSGKAARGKPVVAKSKPPTLPKPSDARLIAAQDAFDAASQARRVELRDLARREADLARDRRELERRHAAARDEAQRALDEARSEYDAALTRWKAQR